MRQIYFYLTDADQRLMLQQLRERFDCRALANPLSSRELVFRDPEDFAVWKPGQYQTALLRERDRFDLSTRDSNGILSVDFQSSAAISFWPCMMRDGALARRSLSYAVSDDILGTPDFDRWAERVFRFVKKHLNNGPSFTYAGAEASQWIASGTKFKQM